VALGTYRELVGVRIAAVQLKYKKISCRFAILYRSCVTHVRITLTISLADILSSVDGGRRSPRVADDMPCCHGTNVPAAALQTEKNMSAQCRHIMRPSACLCTVDRTVFVVVSSWHCDCESSPGLPDACRTVPGGR